MSPVRVGNYDVLQRLAVGGMGEVFLARQRGLPGAERLVVVKVMLPDMLEEAAEVRQFLDEARVAARLNHPNVITTYEVGQHEDIYYLAMEYVHGENLARLMRLAHRQKQRLPLSMAARIVHDAASGLHHAHTAVDEAGRPLAIVHRDVSPQNLMVRADDGVTKVLDFGIALAAFRDTRTKTGVLKGKPAYMPPEQLTGDALTPRGDQYALGLVLWELLTGKRRFSSAIEDMSDSERLSNARSVRSIRADVPAELDAVCQRMLQLDPGARFESCEAVAKALDGIAPTFGGLARGSDLGAWVGEVAREPLEKRRQAIIAAPAGGPPAPPSVGSAQRDELPTSATSSQGAALAEPTGLRISPRATAMVAVLLVGGAAAAGVLLAPKTQDVPNAPRGTLVELPEPGEPAEAVERASAQPAKEGSAPARSVVKVHLRSEPSGATVFAGETILGVTPLDTQALAPGTTHALRFERQGYRSYALELETPSFGEEDATVRLVPVSKKARRTTRRARAEPEKTTAEASADAPRSGYLTVRTNPWSEVRLDGKPMGSTPIFKLEVGVGEHELVMQNKAEGRAKKLTVTVHPGKHSKVDVQLD